MPKISDLLASGVGGVLPMIMAREYKKQQALDAAAEAEAAKAAQAASVGNVGSVAKPMKKGGMTASKRADGIAQRGKTRGTMC
jgi:hypothetical protein